MQAHLTRGELARRALVGLAVAGLVAGWGAVGAAFLLDASRPILVAAVVAAAIATEAAFWVAAVTLGWTAFANRARLWNRLTGRKKQGEV